MRRFVTMVLPNNWFGGHALSDARRPKTMILAAMRLRLGQLSRVCRPLAKCCCIDKVPNVSVRPWGLPLQAEFVKFGAKVHEGGDWHQPFEQVERVK